MADSVAALYEVRWRVQGTGEVWGAIYTVLPARQIVVEDLDSGQTYEFQVRAVSHCGARSEWVSGTQTVRTKNQRVSQGNISMLTVGGIRSAWIGGDITYTATPTSATISVAAGTLQDGSVNPAYAASSATVSGTAGTTTHYWLYYDDSAGQGGSFTLGYTTNYTDLTANSGRVWVGEVDVAFPASGSGSGGGTGGGGGFCPQVDEPVIRRAPDGAQEVIRAGDVHAGDYLLLSSGRWGLVSYSAPEMQQGVRVTGQDGSAITCSTSAPLESAEGPCVPALYAAGVVLKHRRSGVMRAMRVDPVGEIQVQHITCENDCFWVSDYSHHNAKTSQPL